MEKKDLKTVAAGAGKSAAAFLNATKEKVKRVADQNDDGELNLQDVTVIAGVVGNSVKKAAVAAKESAEVKSREIEEKLLQPIFAKNLYDTDFLMPKLIRITEMDKKRASSEVCEGSIGFTAEMKGLRIVNIFRNHIGAFGLSFYPDMDSEIYYVDPSDRNRYIALDDYFGYLKEARVNELQKIAQDLGAKHFKVTYKEQKTVFAKKATKGKLQIKTMGNHGDVDAHQELASEEVVKVEISAKADFPGHDPIEPCLKYLKNEPSIQSLVSMRMDQNSPMSHQEYTLKLSNTSGIKANDAVKIDAALKAMKYSGNATVTSEVQNEARRFFEYEIDF